MFEGVSTLVNLNQNNPETVQGQVEGAYEPAVDAVEGKVNPVECLANLADKSSQNEKTHSQDVVNRGSGERRIIDILG